MFDPGPLNELAHDAEAGKLPNVLAAAVDIELTNSGRKHRQALRSRQRRFTYGDKMRASAKDERGMRDMKGSGQRRMAGDFGKLSRRYRRLARLYPLQNSPISTSRATVFEWQQLAVGSVTGTSTQFCINTVSFIIHHATISACLPLCR
jgi:hypothetical protein